MVKRYSIDIHAMRQQELDLLECLVNIDQGAALDSRADDLVDRLIDAGLVDRISDGSLALTVAGIDRCRSLQLRLTSDAEAAKILAERGIDVDHALAVARKHAGLEDDERKPA